MTVKENSSILSCIVGSTLCFYKQCKCGAMNINYAIYDSKEEKLQKIARFICSECGRKYKSEVFKIDKNNPEGQRIVSDVNKRANLISVIYKNKPYSAVILDKKRIALITGENEKYVLTNEVEMYEGRENFDKNGKPNTIKDYELLYQCGMKIGTTYCPRCDKLIFAKEVEDAKSVLAKDIYNCECGKRFKRYRYLNKFDKKSNLEILIKASKANSPYFKYGIQKGRNIILCMQRGLKEVEKTDYIITYKI